MSHYEKPKEYEEFTVRLITETAAAYLFYFEDLEEEHWIPKSVCDYDMLHDNVSIERWLCKQRELI